MPNLFVQSETPKPIFFQSLGCAKNLVDAEVMLGITSQHQYQIVDDPAQASVIVINTCSFINDSKRESINTILEMAKQKTSGICERLIVTGCLPQRYKADLKAAFPEVDAFVGTGQYADILDFINGKSDEEAGFKHPKYIHSENTPRINSQPKHRAYLKISEGCIKNCAFCIIPKIRGTLRSRTIPSLVTEARHLVRSGVVELCLIGQDLTDYGRDLRDGSDLVRLLELLSQISDLQWIRLLYVYPDDLSEELLTIISDRPNVCKYFDMPIQHINDRMLSLMNRKVSGLQIRQRISKIKSFLPEAAIRSTLIVGYPGETDKEFRELVDFVSEAQFDHLGVFAYSHEEGTASFALPDQLPEEVIQERKSQVLALQQQISRNKLVGKTGSVIPVLIEGPSDESHFLSQGRHQGQAPDVDGVVVVRESEMPSGQIVPIFIERTTEYDLIGRPA